MGGFLIMYKQKKIEYKKEILDFGVCRADPIPTVQELQNYYTTKYYQDANGSTTYDAVYTNEELDHKRLESDLALLALSEKINDTNDKISLLEFGCGEGFFLKQASTQTNWDICGVDFSQFGLQKWHPEISDKCSFGDSYAYLDQYIQENKTFDICVLRNVLEHVVDPRKLLIDLKKILTQRGLLLITVPNDYSTTQMHAMKYGFIDHDFWFLPPDHLYYFNTTNIVSFVEDGGYEVLDMFSSFPVDFFLFHSGSNYVKERKNGKEAHFARVNLDLIMAKSGIKNLLNLYRSMAKCGVGRDITIILQPNNR